VKRNPLTPGTRCIPKSNGCPSRLTILLLALTLGCTGESPQPAGGPTRGGGGAPAGTAVTAGGGNQPPVARSVRIFPNPVLLKGSALAQADGDDPDGDPVTFRYQWLANGAALVGETGATLMPARLKRGDLLSVEVTPTDGKTDGAPLRADAVPIANSPPEVTRIVLPSVVRVGDPVEVRVEGSDADGDPITYSYRWWRNKTLVLEGDRSVLDTTGFARDDTIAVEVTPRDAADQGKPLPSLPVTIANSPPKITSLPPSRIDQGLYQYLVTATDADGDRLTYLLAAGPPDMKIEAASGRIDWRIAPETKGAFSIRVAVEDGRGGRAFQDFELRLP